MKMKFSPILASALIAAIVPSATFAGNHHMMQPPSAPSLLPPPDARAGQCCARRLVPATYRNEGIDIVTQDAVEQVSVSEPEFAARTQAFVTRDGYVRYEVSEPVFRNEAQTIVTRPAYERLVAVPAQMGARSETVVIREPRMVWRRGENLSGVRRLDPNTGEIYCLVEERGQTQVVTRRVVSRPASVQRVAVPAQTQTLNRQVLVTPSQVREIRVPEQTQAVTIQELARPATARTSMTPEQHSTINRQVLVTPEHYEWVQVECDRSGANTAATSSTGPTPVTVNFNQPTQKLTISTTSLQRALASKGLYRGPIDGIYGPLTREAVAEYQRANSLPVTGRVNADVVRGLGLGQ